MQQLTIRQMLPQDSTGAAVLINQLGYSRAVEEVHSWIQQLDRDRERQTAYVACIEEEIVGWIEVSLVHHLQQPPYALIIHLSPPGGTGGERWISGQGDRPAPL